MRNRLQLSCLECRRKKKKCNRLEPCANCIKSDKLCVYTKNTQKSLEFSNQSEYVYRDHETSYYMFNKGKRMDIKWFNLTYVLERMVDFCHLDPKLSYIKLILDSKELEKVVGKRFKRNELNMIKKIYLPNYKTDPELHSLIEYLIGMSFQFCIFNPVTVQTIQQSYLTYGLNSYLINCIAALMLPKYLLIRGVLNPLPLNENIFYIKALYLLSNSSTSKTEIALGAIYLFCFETSFGNSWGALMHFIMSKSACLELRLNMIDADNQTSLKNEESIEVCEKRNIWWCIYNVEVIMSMLYNFPISSQPNPENCHMPHHSLNYSPGPYQVVEDIDHKTHISSSPSIYQKLPHLNHLSILTWACEIMDFFIGKLGEFYKSSKGISERVKILSELDSLFDDIVHGNSYLFDLLEYENNLKANPTDYARTSALLIVLTFNSFIMFFYEALSNCYIDVKDPKVSEKYKIKVKTQAKSLFNFIIKTMKLRNYPDPKIDLTQYYISSHVIPDIFISLIKLFIPITSTEDRQHAQFILELVSEFSLYFPMAQQYSDWCMSQIKTNGRFNYTNDTKTNSQKGMLRILEKSLSKDYFI